MNESELTVDDSVDKALNLLLQASRVDPTLRTAVGVVDEAVNNLRDKNTRLGLLRIDAEAGVDRVRAVHPREEHVAGRPVCGWCRDNYEDPWEWPCPTIAALDGDA